MFDTIATVRKGHMFKMEIALPQSGRKKIDRTIAKDHSYVCFKPCGVRGSFLERVTLEADELEAIRLSDTKGLYQQECANRMGVSRTTFSRIITSAHAKIADALLHTKALKFNIGEELKNLK